MTNTTLSTLVEGLNRRGIEATLRGDGDTAVDDAFHDHRTVRPGSLFCCVVGATADGHDHASAAVDAGAVALVCSRPIGAGVPEIIVPDVRIAMGPVAAMIHGDPSAELLCVGITGTNGKTTTAALIGSILRADGRNVEVIGTLSGVRTTPEATDLQRELAALRRRGCDALVMEVSSHGLAQHRVDGMHFDVAVFTNLGRDHLDFHETMEEYFRAKARLFEPSFSTRGVVDLDDAYGQLLRDASDIPMTGFRLADGDPVVTAAPIEFTWRGRRVRMSLAGRFNLANALAAATTASVLGVDDDTIRAGLEAADPVPGRFEVVPTASGVTVVVDFAHTPDGIRAVIEAARGVAGPNRVLLVFGAGGDRDPSKRPLMGEAAEQADVVVVTNDNPRSEDPEAIAEAIIAGMTAPDRVIVELDRTRAIAIALDRAEPGDVVVIAGKGHETTQTIGETTRDFDDRGVARRLVAERGWSA